MTLMRPGTKIRFWTPRFKHRPDVEPPGLLKLVSATCIVSVVGFLVYAVAQTLTQPSLVSNGWEVAYVALLHFVLPFAAFYSITTNSRLSRAALTVYVVTLGVATIAGEGLLGSLPIEPVYRTATAAAALVIVLAWLYASPNMRYYYAALSDKPIPPDLVAREAELRPKPLLSPRARAVVSACLDYVEIFVLLGFIAVVIFAVLSTG